MSSKEKQPTHFELVLDYMLHHPKGITTWDAITLFGCTRLSAVIFQIKKDGWEIESDAIIKKNRYGHPCTYSRYRLTGRSD